MLNSFSRSSLNSIQEDPRDFIRKSVKKSQSRVRELLAGMQARKRPPNNLLKKSSKASQNLQGGVYNLFPDETGSNNQFQQQTAFDSQRNAQSPFDRILQRQMLKARMAASRESSNQSRGLANLAGDHHDGALIRVPIKVKGSVVSAKPSARRRHDESMISTSSPQNQPPQNPFQNRQAALGMLLSQETSLDNDQQFKEEMQATFLQENSLVNQHKYQEQLETSLQEDIKKVPFETEQKQIILKSYKRNNVVVPASSVYRRPSALPNTSNLQEIQKVVDGSDLLFEMPGNSMFSVASGRNKGSQMLMNGSDHKQYQNQKDMLHQSSNYIDDNSDYVENNNSSSMLVEGVLQGSASKKNPFQKATPNTMSHQNLNKGNKFANKNLNVLKGESLMKSARYNSKYTNKLKNLGSQRDRNFVSIIEDSSKLEPILGGSQEITIQDSICESDTQFGVGQISRVLNQDSKNGDLLSGIANNLNPNLSLNFEIGFDKNYNNNTNHPSQINSYLTQNSVVLRDDIQRLKEEHTAMNLRKIEQSMQRAKMNLHDEEKIDKYQAKMLSYKDYFAGDRNQDQERLAEMFGPASRSVSVLKANKKVKKTRNSSLDLQKDLEPRKEIAKVSRIHDIVTLVQQQENQTEIDRSFGVNRSLGHELKQNQLEEDAMQKQNLSSLSKLEVYKKFLHKDKIKNEILEKNQSLPERKQRASIQMTENLLITPTSRDSLPHLNNRSKSIFLSDLGSKYSMSKQSVTASQTRSNSILRGQGSVRKNLLSNPQAMRGSLQPEKPKFDRYLSLLQGRAGEILGDQSSFAELRESRIYENIGEQRKNSQLSSFIGESKMFGDDQSMIRSHLNLGQSQKLNDIWSGQSQQQHDLSQDLKHELRRSSQQHHTLLEQQSMKSLIENQPMDLRQQKKIQRHLKQVTDQYRRQIFQISDQLSLRIPKQISEQKRLYEKDRRLLKQILKQKNKSTSSQNELNSMGYSIKTPSRQNEELNY